MAGLGLSRILAWISLGPRRTEAWMETRVIVLNPIRRKTWVGIIRTSNFTSLKKDCNLQANQMWKNACWAHASTWKFQEQQANPIRSNKTLRLRSRETNCVHTPWKYRAIVSPINSPRLFFLSKKITSVSYGLNLNQLAQILALNSITEKIKSKQDRSSKWSREAARGAGHRGGVPGRPRGCPTTPTWGWGQMGLVTLKSCNSRNQRGTPSPAWGFQRAVTVQRPCQWPVAPCGCTTAPRCHFPIDKDLQVFGKRRKDMCNPSLLLLHKIFYCILAVFPAASGIAIFKFFRVIICTVPFPPSQRADL